MNDESPTPDEIRRVMSAIGKKGGLIGGKARAQKLTQEQRTNIARNAALARWKKKDMAQTESLPTPSKAFLYGADAMRSRVVALLIEKGYMSLAQEIMQISMPIAWPEIMDNAHKSAE